MSDNSRVDWGDNGKFQRLSRKMSNSGSFSSLLGKNKAPRSNKNNNKYTGFTVKNNGGNIGEKAIAGENGLKITRVDRKVNFRGATTAGYSKDGGAATRRTQRVYSGGGTPSKSVVQSKPRAVKVQPEKPGKS